MSFAETLDPAAPPEWFVTALAAPFKQATVEVNGTGVTYRTYGDEGEGVVLLHGGAAHGRWWDHIAPLLAHDHRVVVPDLSGHGDSGHRDAYSLDTWAHEVLAVAAHAGLAAPPTIIGHSMGGFVALRAASMYGSAIAGAVAIDSPVRDITPEERAAREQRAFGPLRVYPSQEAALARFHPIPDQPSLPYITEHVAKTSIREVSGGWSWKFDPGIFARHQLTLELLTRLDCRVALFRAEHGIVSPQVSDLMYDRLGRLAPVIEIPAAGHHVMLDQPLALVTGIRTLLSDWDHSTPASARRPPQPEERR
jgi:pimeloyl-ACP methyl ester carboxylesterase